MKGDVQMCSQRGALLTRSRVTARAAGTADVAVQPSIEPVGPPVKPGRVPVNNSYDHTRRIAAMSSSSSSSSSSSAAPGGKKTHREREKEWQNDGLKKIGGVNFDVVADRIVGDKRFERVQREKQEVQQKGVAALKEKAPAASATFDAFTRMAAGLEGRTIADKISDPNRPTWEQYKKDNEDKLNMGGMEAKKMAEYRQELDRERELKLSRGSNHRKANNAISDSDDDDDDDDSDDDGRKKKSKKEKKSKKSKKSKKHRKEKKRKRSSDSDGSDAGSDDDSNDGRKRRKEGEMRLSEIMNNNDDDDYVDT